MTSLRRFEGVRRDGMMRGSLEAHMIYAAPSELLVALPVSGATQSLLGAFSQTARGLKADSVPRGRYSAEKAVAAIKELYTSGKPPTAPGSWARGCADVTGNHSSLEAHDSKRGEPTSIVSRGGSSCHANMLIAWLTVLRA